jgi:allantoicase
VEPIDLASERLGGRALLANDEFFAPKENLLKPGRGEFIEGKYTDRGKWMDGWETRRRRELGHDWCIIELGAPGVIQAVVVDTNHFKGNHPEACSLEACVLETPPTLEELRALDDRWTELLPRSPLRGHAENRFAVHPGPRVSHVRLNIFPDGGVARLRILGEVRPAWDHLLDGGAVVDLAAAEHGGVPLACSDEFFSRPLNLIMPGRSANMGDGWETRRRRGPGHDWVVLRLGRRGTIERVELETTHFKGNYPDTASLEGCDTATDDPSEAGGAPPDWREIVPRTKLQADAQHVFRDQLAFHGPVSHLRLNIYPDGGVARLRVFGRPVDAPERA